MSILCKLNELFSMVCAVHMCQHGLHSNHAPVQSNSQICIQMETHMAARSTPLLHAVLKQTQSSTILFWFLLQMERLELLMHHAQSHGLPLEDLTAPSDSDDEEADNRVVGIKAAQHRLKSIHQLYGTPGKPPNGQLASPRSVFYFTAWVQSDF